MSEETTGARNKATVSAAIAAWAAGDVTTYAAVYAEDLKWTIIGSTPISGTYESRAALFSTMRSVLGDVMAEPLTPEVLGIVAEDEWVYVRLRSCAKAKNGIQYDQRYCWALRLSDDLIVEGTAYMDTALVDAVLAVS